MTKNTLTPACDSLYHRIRLKKRKEIQNKLHKSFKILLHLLESAIAVMTIIIPVGLLSLEIYRMLTRSGYFDTPHTYLKNILTIVVELEFVKMLINMTSKTHKLFTT